MTDTERPERSVQPLVVHGEPFSVELDDELGFVLTHQRWSFDGVR